jgi:ABC-type transport system involved in cytochrome bd biosynthesis fused ATPase/permease subunit
MIMMMMMIIIITIIIIIIMYDYTKSNLSHWNCNEKLKEKFGNCTRKTLDRFTTKDSYTWNITHNTESTAV